MMSQCFYFSYSSMQLQWKLLNNRDKLTASFDHFEWVIQNKQL